MILARMKTAWYQHSNQSNYRNLLIKSILNVCFLTQVIILRIAYTLPLL